MHFIKITICWGKTPQPGGTCRRRVNPRIDLQFEPQRQKKPKSLAKQNGQNAQYFGYDQYASVVKLLWILDTMMRRLDSPITLIFTLLQCD